MYKKKKNNKINTSWFYSRRTLEDDVSQCVRVVDTVTVGYARRIRRIMHFHKIQNKVGLDIRLYLFIIFFSSLLFTQLFLRTGFVDPPIRNRIGDVKLHMCTNRVHIC
jgi:hypothetical protein